MEWSFSRVFGDGVQVFAELLGADAGQHRPAPANSLSYPERHAGLASPEKIRAAAMLRSSAAIKRGTALTIARSSR